MTDNVMLRADGQEFSGWTQVSVSMDVRAIAWSFSLTMTTTIVEVHGPLLKKGQRVELFIGTDRVMTARIDEIAVSYDEANVNYDVTGRSLTGQLVDSAAIYPGSQFSHLSLPDIARELCAPFGIDVTLENHHWRNALQLEYSEFPTVRIEQGESVYELLERLARQAGVLLTTNASGHLVMTQAGTRVITPALVLGENIKSCRAIDSILPRASQYIVKGSGTGLDFGAQDTVGNAVEIIDPDIDLHRPRIVICETVLTTDIATQRGQWQRCRDLGSGTQAEYTLTGWTHDGGVFTPNVLVSVDDDLADIHDQWLVVTVTLVEGDDGRLATLTVQPPESLVITKEQNKQSGAFF
ncbi:phage baseplate assembly protein [Shewanella xiamenensis]|uniref:phage baseplate assembly protein n=1 Tax=Shewanella xiamenensis TaxID=332186 RepID=UPI0008499A46|nr:hypothetical protein [Shewanella xiamenensis]ODR86705.1 hypothetical protein ABT47_16025 [Shewanella xiamenensis]